jgi:hypothetical protein
MDPSEENAATLPGVLRELLARESTKMINNDSKQKEMRGSANFGDNNHGTNLDLLTHEPQIDFKTRKEIILQTKSNDARGFHQIIHRVSDSYSECTETKMQAQPLEPPTGDPKPEKMDPQRFNATLDMEKEATTSTPQSTTTKFNQPEEFVAAGKTFSQGTDQPTTEQDNEGREAYQTPEKQGNSSELQGSMENATSGRNAEEDKTSRFDQPIQPGAEDLESFSTPGVFKTPNEDKLIFDMSAVPEEIKKQLLSLLATSTPATVSKRETTTGEEWKEGTPLIQPNFLVQDGAQDANRGPAAQQDVTTGVSKQQVQGILGSEVTSPPTGSFGAQDANRGPAAQQDVTTGVSKQQVQGILGSEVTSPPSG